MCAVSHNCPLLGRNNETGDAPAAQARPWAPQFGPSVPLINNIQAFYYSRMRAAGALEIELVWGHVLPL